MLIVLGFYKRKPGLTLEQFQAHWRDIHGPMIVNHPDVRRYVRRYVQHHFESSTGFPGMGGLDYDGFSESWFESIEARKEMHELTSFASIVEDEHKFLDMDATRILMFDKQVVQIGRDHSAEWMAGHLG